MAAGVDDLTEREREVLRLLLGGHTAKSIAAELDLSVHTVNDYMREARKKLGVSSSREAARILGEQEKTAPQKPAPEQIGMEAAALATDTPKPSGEAAGKSRLPWIIGVFVMIAAALAATLLFASAGTSDQNTAQVEAARAQDAAARASALSFVRLIDKSDYAGSWADAGPMFRSAVTARDWAAQVDPVRSPLGAVVSRKVSTIDTQANLPGAPEGNYMIVVFDTAFAKSPASAETVVLREENGSWGVVGYFIR